MKLAAAIRRREAGLLNLLIAGALLLAVAMTWRMIAAERRYRETAGRTISAYSALIGEDLARRTSFEYEQLGLTTLRAELYELLNGKVEIRTREEIARSYRFPLRDAAPLVGQIFVADFIAGTITPPLRPDLHSWVLANLENVAHIRMRLPASRFIVRVPLADRDHWIAFNISRLRERRVAGVIVRPEGLTELAARAMQKRAPFLGALGERLTLDDVFVRLRTPRHEIYATPGAFNPAFGTRVVLPDSVGEILGGGTVECSIAPQAVPRILTGGIPRADERVPLLMLTANILLLGAVGLVIRRARQLDRLRADFVAGVSHELRTPLTQIRMFADSLMLSRMTSAANRQRALENIARESMRLAHLVDNLLSFARGERGTLRVTAQPRDVCGAVREAVASFGAIAEHERVTLRLALDDGCVAAVDESALRQIVLNLLDNAVKYGPPGGTVDVRVSAAGEAVRVEVEDEGAGIPADQRERIWMKFYRLPRDVETHRSGSGIGLAVVRELVERHGGRYGVETGSRGGSRFVIDFPAGAPQ